MALTYDLKKIAGHESLCWVGEKMNPVTEGLIYSTMSVGLGSITAANVDEWMARLDYSDRLFGTMLKTGTESRPFTRAEVEAHVGLVVNVSDEKRKGWASRLTDSFFRERR
jgi:hypothetical protein